MTTARPLPRFSAAGTLLECLADRDFDGLAAALRPDAELQGLTPGGRPSGAGRDEIVGLFRKWFGDATEFGVVDAYLGDVGPRLHLSWRVQLRAGRLGPGWFVVEQQVYADTDDSGLITRLSLLCSGYCPSPTPLSDLAE